jgi:hypothetical protein
MYWQRETEGLPSPSLECSYLHSLSVLVENVDSDDGFVEVGVSGLHRLVVLETDT